MDNKKFRYNIIALFTVFTFWIMLLSSVSMRTNDGQQSSSLHNAGNNYSLVTENTMPVYAEEILTSSSLKITVHQESRNLYRPESFCCSSGSSMRMQITAMLIFTIICVLSTDIPGSRKFIIKYIHDQDGHKITPFVLFTKPRYYLSYKTILRRNKNGNIIYSDLRSDLCRNDNS